MQTLLKPAKKILGFVLPKRSEALLILLSTFFIVGTITPEFVKSFASKHSPLPEFSLLLFAGVAIATGLGIFSLIQLKKNWWFVVGLILTLMFCGVLLHREQLLFQRHDHFTAYGYPMIGLGAIGGAMFASFGMTKLFFCLEKQLHQKLYLRGITREKIMIGVAVVLFACLTLRNILIADQVDWAFYSQRQNPILQIIIGIFTLLFVAVFPGWLITRIRGGWAMLIVTAYLGTLAGWMFSFDMVFGFFFGVYAIVFTGIVVAITSYLDFWDANSQSGIPGENQTKEVLGPGFSSRRSLWGSGMVVVALLFAAVLWNFSGQALMFGGSQRMELARQLKNMATSSGVVTKFDLSINRGVGTVYAGIVFSENAGADCLLPFACATNQFTFSLTNLRPEIKTDPLKKITPCYISIRRSSITPQQLVNLNGASMHLSDFEIVGSKTTGAFSPVGNCYLGDVRPGETANLLRCIDTNTFQGQVFIYGGRLSKDDWEQMLESSRFFSIWSNVAPKLEAVQTAIDSRTPRMLILQCEFDLGESLFWEITCNTDVSVRPEINIISPENQVMFWDAVFASHGSDWALDSYREISGGNPSLDSLLSVDESHWIFETNKQGKPTGLLLPFGKLFVEQVSELTDLETLSLDVRWLEPLRNVDKMDVPRLQDISDLGKLTNLKRLDLPVGLWGMDYSFLGQMQQLEYLQFDLVGNGANNGSFGFTAASCPNLKTLVLFGNPTVAMAVEIAKLPKLESLKVIVDLPLSGQGLQIQSVDSNAPFAFVQKLKKSIGEGVKFEIVATKDDRPELPMTFTKHLEGTRKSIRKKYLGKE